MPANGDGFDILAVLTTRYTPRFVPRLPPVFVDLAGDGDGIVAVAAPIAGVAAAAVAVVAPDGRANARRVNQVGRQASVRQALMVGFEAAQVNLVPEEWIVVGGNRTYGPDEVVELAVVRRESLRRLLQGDTKCFGCQEVVMEEQGSLFVGVAVAYLEDGHRRCGCSSVYCMACCTAACNALLRAEWNATGRTYAINSDQSCLVHSAGYQGDGKTA